MVIKQLAIPVKLTFKQKKEIAPNVWHFVFVPETPFSWKAGQHALFEIPLLSGKTGRKPFSISAAPSEGVVSFTTRIYPEHASPFKQALLKMKAGTRIKLRGAIGPLHISPTSRRKYAFLATGIGITPFRSILTELAHHHSDIKITFFYVGNKDNHFFKEEMGDVKNALPNVSIVYIYKPERITGQIIEDTLGNEIPETTFFLSGSYAMIKTYRRTLTGLGVKRRRIKSDPFFRLKPPHAKEIVNKL